MHDGRLALCRLTRRDFGYDLAAWHEYLKRDDGYRHPYGRATVFQAIERAIAAPKRQRLAARLTEEERRSGTVPTVPDPGERNRVRLADSVQADLR